MTPDTACSPDMARSSFETMGVPCINGCEEPAMADAATWHAMPDHADHMANPPGRQESGYSTGTVLSIFSRNASEAQARRAGML
jgi:hypothetical protein